MNKLVEMQARNVLKMDKEQQKIVAQVLGISSFVVPFVVLGFAGLKGEYLFGTAGIIALGFFFNFARLVKNTRAKIAAEKKEENTPDQNVKE